MSYGNYHFHNRLREKYNYCCAWCGDDRDGGYDAEGYFNFSSQLCVDHVKTRYTGGSDYDSNNFQILCRRCNSIKGAYCLPKLNPRLPETDPAKILTAQTRFKNRIMPSRRCSSEGADYPTRTELGY